MYNKIMKNFILFILIMLSLILVGCGSGSETPPEPEKEKISVEYDEIVYYSQIGKIKVSSIYEDDEFLIESLNTKVIKILENNGNDLIAKAVGLGEADIKISNAYGDELTITIVVEAKGEFAPPIEKMELSIKEEGPYYIGQTYHLDVKFYPEIFNDSYRFITSEDYELNKDDLTVVFKRSGKMTISVFAEKNSKRVNLQVDVTVNPEEHMYEVLFIGNSLTYVHDIPKIIQNMIEANGGYMVYSQDTPGGSYLIDHENNFNLLIDKYNFTHVILQGQSYEPIDKKQSFLDAMVKFGTKAKERGAEVIVYESWAYDKEVYKNLTRYQMTERLRESYEEAARLIGGKITRSGEAFRLFEETYGRTPSLYQDMNHQSLYGAYLSACVHYSTITGERASDNFYKMDGVDSTTAAQIRRIADLISFPEE